MKKLTNFVNASCVSFFARVPHISFFTRALRALIFASKARISTSFATSCLLALFVVTLFTITSCSKKQAQGDLLAHVMAKGELVIATEGTWAPWTYHDENDKLVGFDVEVAEKIAEKLGVRATFVEAEWDGIFAGIDSKRYDIAANGVEITDERSQKYDFSVPYAYIRTAIITRTDRNDILSFEDLRGKTTANSLGSTYAELAESYGAKTTTIDSFDQTLELVLHRRVDATLNAEVSFYDYMSVHPEAPFKVSVLTQDASLVALPLRKGADTAALRDAIDSAIAELASSGELAAISVKYFGSDITEE
ncbi:MAG: transporter substrate-binding domain-containing protein [Treponema sp.]|nr:transporter substrate-binding domain-containing protein [Treponema sp.]